MVVLLRTAVAVSMHIETVGSWHGKKDQDNREQREWCEDDTKKQEDEEDREKGKESNWRWQGELESRNDVSAVKVKMESIAGPANEECARHENSSAEI